MVEPVTTDLAAIRAAVMHEVEGSRAPRPWWTVASVLVVSQLAVVATIAVGWSLLFAAPIAMGWQTAALTVAVGAATVVAVRPPGEPALRLGAALAVAAAAAGAAFFASAHPHVFALTGEADCLIGELGASILPALAMLIVLRSFAFSLQSALLGGLAVACTGVLVLDVTCPIGTLSHVVAFHLCPAAAVAAGLALVRSRLTSRSFAP